MPQATGNIAVNIPAGNSAAVNSMWSWPRSSAVAMLWICTALFTPYFKAGFLYYPLIAIAFLSSSWRIWLPLRVQVFMLLLIPAITVQLYQHLQVTEFGVFVDETKYYLGFVAMYPFILLSLWHRPSAIYKLIQWIFVILCVTLIFESVLINLAPSAVYSLGNYPDFAVHISHRTVYFGFYQRPYGLGGSYAETTTLIAILMTFLFIQKRELSVPFEILGFTAIVLGISGTGGTFAMVYIVVRFLYSKYRVFVGPLAIIGLAMPLAVTYLPTFSDSSPLWKISYPYFSYLILQKWSVFLPDSPERFSEMQYFWGHFHELRKTAYTWSDFGAAGLFKTFGVAGFLTYGGAIVTHASKRTLFPLCLMLLSMGHYAALFSQTGQLVFCLLLAYGLTASAARRHPIYR